MNVSLRKHTVPHPAHAEAKAIYMLATLGEGGGRSVGSGRGGGLMMMTISRVTNVLEWETY